MFLHLTTAIIMVGMYLMVYNLLKNVKNYQKTVFEHKLTYNT